MATSTTLFLPAPTGGEAPSLPPDQLRDNVARRLKNWLVHHPGRIVPRGNIGGPAATDTGDLTDPLNGGTLLTAYAFEDSLGVSWRLPSATPLVDNWRVPVNRPTNAADLAQPSLEGGGVNLLTGVSSFIPIGSALSVAGPSIAKLDDSVYSVSFGGVSTAVPTGVAPLNAIRKGNPHTGAAIVLTNGPRFVQSIFSHYGRLFAAAARAPGGSDYDTSNIWYTIAGGTTAFTNVATDWQDPVTGELNRVAIGAANDGDFVVGFGRAAGHLVVFKRNSVWILYGTAPSNFTLRQLRPQTGCVDFRSIAVCEEGVYFASQLGYELFDGSTFKLVSEPVADTWLAASNAGVASGSVNHAFIRSSPLPNGYIHVALGTDGITANSTDGTTLSWLYHRASAAWIDTRTKLITELGLGAGGCINRFVESSSYVVAMGASKWARADHITYGGEALGVVDQTSSTAYDVDLLWQTRLANMADRWTTAQIHAAMLDCHQNFLSAAATTASWATVTAEDGFGSALVFPAGATVLGYASPGPTRARPLFKSKPEVSRGDISLTLTSSLGASAATRLGRADVYGFGVGWTPGRERALA